MRAPRNTIMPDSANFLARGHWQKTLRAREHILELQKSLARWRTENNFSYDTEETIERDGYLRLSTKLRIKRPIPLEWATLIGDALQNMRAGLDHLAYAMVDRSNLTKAQLRDIQFPIGGYADIEAYEAELQRKQHFTQGVREFLVGLRPFKAGDLRYWHLNEMAKIDRHRILLTTLAGIREAYRDFRYDENGMVLKQYDPARSFATIWDSARPDQPIPVHDGMEIVRETMPVGETSGFTWGINLELLFDEPNILSHEAVLDVLEELVFLVAETARTAEKNGLVLFADA